jgi:hypothetical protein
LQQVRRNSVALIAFAPRWFLWESQMVIDLDSWESGYADGRFGRRPRCPVCLDQRSYSSGYDVGRAVNAGLCRNAPRLRYTRWPIYLRFQIHSSGDDVPA